MATFRNKNYTKRDYDCTNVVACVADKAPNDNFVPSTGTLLLDGLDQLYTQAGVTYYGYL